MVPGNQQQALAKTSPVLLPAVTIGHTQIAEAQRLLSRYGLLSGAADGQLGERTREAVRAFQISIDAPADGQITEATLAQLQAAPPSQEIRGRALVALGEEAVRAARKADAIRLYAAGIRLDPRNGDALIALGELQSSVSNNEDARRTFVRATQLGGPVGEEARRHIAGLPAPVTIAPQAQPAAPAPQTAAMSPPRTPTGNTDSPGRHVPQKVWEAIAWAPGVSESNAVERTVFKDKNKDVATAKAIEYCRKVLSLTFYSMRYVDRCAIKSVSERDLRE
jgi:peptidoglycan hydrolase-like protein with peptidoglycan-binding domain